ncbi:MAG: hypothetical protein WCK73_14690 [Deltaproteobacteria bacterium]
MKRILPWVVAAALTLACFAFQNRTGPTYPLEGSFPTSRGDVAFKFLRSEEIGKGLQIMLRDPVPPGVSAKVRWRRYKSNDGWSETPMNPGTFRFSRRGTAEEVRGVGATLPSLPERAGKYEYQVLVDDGNGSRSVTGDRPIYARYKAPVPHAVLLVHILVVFLSMMLALRTGIAALAGGEVRGLAWATIGSLVLGAFVLGPIVQKYAFGVYWSGWPFGYDWTDNKVLVELAAWLLAAVTVSLARNPRIVRGAVIAATAVTLAVYFIPHSIFGSEYDYTRGSGHGTAG